MKSSDDLDAIETAARKYRRAEKAHETARAEVVACVIAALRSGAAPGKVAKMSPFTDAYVRKLARANSIPAYEFRRHPRSREWMEKNVPNWRNAARAVAAVCPDLDDGEYVGGVIYGGLILPAMEGNPAAQRAEIVRRLTLWVTRDADGSWWRTQDDYPTTHALAVAIDGALEKSLRPWPEVSCE